MKFALALLFTATIFVPNYSFAEEDCSTTEEAGNTISEALVAALNAEHEGDEIEINSFQKLTVKEVTDLKFANCNLSLWVSFDLVRQYLGDKTGRINLTGHIYEIDETHVCVNEVKVPKLEMDDTSEAEIFVYRSLAEFAIEKNYCFKW